MALGTTGMVVAAALVAGAAGAGTAALVLETSRPADLTADGGADRVPALEERLARQEKELDSLRARLDEVAQARPAAGNTNRARFVKDATEAIQDANEAIQAAYSRGGIQKTDAETGKPVPSPGDEAAAANADDITPAEQAKFEAAYKRMRAKEQEDAAKARAAAVAIGLRARLDRLPETLALTDAQKDAAVKIIMDRNEKMRQAFADAQAAGGTDVARVAQEKAATIRQDALQQLQQSLTQEQVKAVEQVADRGGGQGRAGAFTGRGVGGAGGGRGNGGANPAPGGQPAPPPK
jgi:hypothetical protein